MQQAQAQSLPQPDAASAAHSLLVAEHLRERIAAAGGRLGFAAFMHEALYAPGLGYYSAGAAKFGAAGDFVTAPEVSPVFGHVLARQCAAAFDNIARPAILEFGAGSGKLAVDLLTRLADLNALPDSYRILEVSADLRERQHAFLREAVPQFMGRVSWLDALPQDHCGVIVANEVLDALPVERFVRHDQHVAQVAVEVQGEHFVFCEQPASKALVAAVARIEEDLGRQLPDGYTSEVCLAASAWIASLAALLPAGLVFLFDYGVSRREYYAEDRSAGWLRCHFRHHAHSDPLVLPGIQDITAWVDFTAVAGAAVESGFDIAGYVTQSHFLIDGGLADELAGFAELSPAAQLKLSGQVKLLTLPGEMGENFKCLGLRRGSGVIPAGLRTSDRTSSL